MKKISLKYNPYTVETVVLVDGKEVKTDSRLSVGDAVLQSWIENLPQIVYEEFNARNFELEFSGLQIDFEDVNEIVNNANENGFNISLSFDKSKSTINETYSDVKSIFDIIKNGDVNDLKDEAFKSAFEDIITSEFPVAVFATMSAGKSTLINAMLSHDIMPSQNEACTAVITKVKDTDSACFSAVAYDTNDNIIQEYDRLTLEQMEQLNSNSNVSTIEVECDIPFVKANDLSLVLIDTPGPNNARDESHKIITRKMLNKSEKNVILFVLNATNSFSNDEDYLLREVAKAMSTADKQVKDRFIFVVNKLDEFKKDKDDVAETLEKVREGLIEKGIENPKVFPISALAGLYIRTVDDDEEDEDLLDDKDKFIRKLNRREDLHFEQYAPLSTSEKSEINSQLEDAENHNDKEKQALIHSGIVSVESAICTYLNKYAKTEKIRRAVKFLLSCVNNAEVFEQTRIALANETENRDELTKKLDDIIARIESAENFAKIKSAIQKITIEKELELLIREKREVVQELIMEKYPQKGQMVSFEEYNEIVKPIVSLAKDLESDMIIELEYIVKAKLNKLKRELLDIYNNEIKSLVDCEMKDFKNIKIDVSFPMQKFDFSKFKSRVTVTKTVEVTHYNDNKKWYKPWTWFSSSSYTTTEKQKEIDLDKVRQELAEYQKSIARNADAASSYAVSLVEKTKEDFLKSIVDINEDVIDKLIEYKSAASIDVAKADEKIKEYQERLDWMESIRNKVYESVSI